MELANFLVFLVSQSSKLMILSYFLSCKTGEYLFHYAEIYTLDKIKKTANGSDCGC